METVKFIGLLCLTWLIVEGAEPIQFVKRVLGIHDEKMPKHWALIIITKLLACELCTGFWMGLIYYLFSGYEGFVLLACITSVSAELFARMINFIFNFVLNQWKK
nr:hypothetical protein [uncultured Flavobacterium sp.]